MNKKASIHPITDDRVNGREIDRKHSVVSAMSIVSLKMRQFQCCQADPVSSRGRRNQSAQILIIALLPIFVLFIQTTITLNDASKTKATKNVIREDTLFSIETGNFIHYMQIERGATSLYIGSFGNPETFRIMLNSYTNTDEALNAMTKWQNVGSDAAEYFQSKKAMAKMLLERRTNVTLNLSTASAEITFYSETNAELINWLADAIQKSEETSTWRTLVAYHMLVLSKEEAGRERAFGIQFFTNGLYKIGLDWIKLLLFWIFTTFTFKA